MAITNQQVTVSTTAVALHSPDADGAQIVLTTSQNIYIGNASVSTDTGYLHNKNDAPLHLDLGPGEVLYAVRAGMQDSLITLLMVKNQ
jgi:hypothetical protein